MYWLAHITGFDGGSFASLYGGILGDVGELGILAALWASYRHGKCQSCWRWPARHPVEGTTYRTCRHHFTEDEHDRLKIHHALHWPAQHEFLKKPKV